jgi:hypothetical protein
MSLIDEATAQRNYERFLERVLASKQVWGLGHPISGWAVCDSYRHEHATVYVFWSDRAYAKRCCKDSWSIYAPAAIDLESFTQIWLPGMHEEGCFVGPNWTAGLCGLEIDPLEIARRLIVN